MARRRRPTGAFVTVALLLMALLATVPGPTSAQEPPFGRAIPRDPPRADLITFGELDELGQAQVTGAPGAVLPNATVQLTNLDTTHQAVVRSAEADGSFSTRLFAPPGSNVMVRHGPADIDLWNTVEQGGATPGLTVFPSTTIHQPRQHEATEPTELAFATTGAVETGGDQASQVRSAWTLQGTVGPADALQAGDQVEVTATLRVYSDGISSDRSDLLDQVQVNDLIVRPWPMVFDATGTPVLHINQPGSSRLTPTGLPILDGRRPTVPVVTTWEVGDWSFAGSRSIEADLTFQMDLPADMPAGVYRPEFHVLVANVPAHQGEDWVSAQVLSADGWHVGGAGGFAGRLPLLRVQEASAGPMTRRLVWRLLADTPSLGLRGAGAVEDASVFQPASFVVTQGAPYVIPPVDPYTGQPVAYRIEPHLPMISHGRGAAPITPMIPFDLPGGELCVTVHQPDGQVNDVGCSPMAQSTSGDPSTRGGVQLNAGTIEVTETYALTANDERFRMTFDQPGHHVVEMRGWVEDVWGTRYDGGGTYEVWVAHPLDLDPGILPGTPLAVGDALNAALRVQPHVQADVTVAVEHFPYSDPSLRELHLREGRANRFGYFAPTGTPIRLHEPGEYRVEVAARYTDPTTGEMWMGAATWGGVVMTPPEEAVLRAHGRRGLDTADLGFDDDGEPLDWYFLCDLTEQSDDSGHVFNPYLNGDVVWSRDDPDLADSPACLGDALIMGASVEDTSTDGQVEAAILERHERNGFTDQPIGPTMADRIVAEELPLFSSTTTGEAPTLRPDEVDQVAYAYLSSQRPGVRVREAVAEDLEGSGYWRFDDMFDGQPGVGTAADLPDDVKFQFVGTVFRDLESGLTEYGGQATGWVHTDPDDLTDDNAAMQRSRVMPPFPSIGNGGWRDCGGPLLVEQGREVHQFVLPTGVRPGTVLEVGDAFNFAGHVMPTLDSRIDVEVTSPSGQTHVVSGRANRIGWFHDPTDAFPVDEPGRWTAQVRVWHDGAIGNGQLVDCDPDDPFDPDRPCASGGLLGSSDGSFSFYVVPTTSAPLQVATPEHGPMTFPDGVQPIEVSGPVPDGVSDASGEFTTTMPGVILEEGELTIADGRWSFRFDPTALQEDFSNVDLASKHIRNAPGLSDTFALGIHLRGMRDGQPSHHATMLTIQGDLVQPMGEPAGRLGEDVDHVDRVAGANRFTTAIEISRRTFPAANAAVLARSHQFPDALAASTLASEVGGPILLTGPGGLHADVAAELDRLGVDTVYLVGGEAALSSQVEADVAARGWNVRRLGGTDRFDTAARIADEVVALGGAVDSATIALGRRFDGRDAFPDALAASQIATRTRRPMLLVTPDSLPEATASALTRLVPGGATIRIAGGTAAVSQAVEDAIVRLGYATRRVAGSDRYETATLLADAATRSGAIGSEVWIASGRDFPDALAAGPAAAAAGAVLVLTDPTALPDATATWLASHRETVDRALILGGTAAVSDDQAAAVAAHILDDP